MSFINNRDVFLLKLGTTSTGKKTPADLVLGKGSVSAPYYIFMRWKRKQAPSRLFMSTNHIYESSALMTYHLQKVYLLMTILSDSSAGKPLTMQTSGSKSGPQHPLRSQML